MALAGSEVGRRAGDQMESARCGRKDDVRRRQCGQDERSRNVHQSFARRTRARQVGVGWRGSEAFRARPLVPRLLHTCHTGSSLELYPSKHDYSPEPAFTRRQLRGWPQLLQARSVCALSLAGHTETRRTFKRHDHLLRLPQTHKCMRKVGTLLVGKGVTVLPKS